MFSVATAIFAILLAALALPPVAGAQQTPASPPTATAPASPASSAPANPSQTSPTAPLPRGKKLFLKNGTYQLVREYQIEGDRIRYYDLDSQSWEEMPADLVDWDATKKEAAKEQQEENALIKEAQKQQMEQNAEPLDIDASVQIAPKVFLPDGLGLFAFDGVRVVKMAQIAPAGSVSTGNILERVLVPIPIVPERHSIFIPGAHATFRIQAGEPEFYLRTTQPDEPELDLVHAKIEKGKRLIENLDEIAQQRSASRHSVSIHIMEMAEGLYRVTVEQNLPPGEYAVLEVLRGAEGQSAENRGEMNLYVWDFGLDAAPANSEK